MDGLYLDFYSFIHMNSDKASGKNAWQLMIVVDPYL